jgi:hypothetical protein
MPWYARRFGPAGEFKRQSVQIRNRADYDKALDEYRKWRKQFLDESGGLKASFQPAKLTAVFAGDSGRAVERSVIPVPKGPVENW